MNFSKVVLIIICLLFSTSLYADKCTKEEAIKAVEQACKDIAEDTSPKGEKALKLIKKRRHCGDNYVWIQSKDLKMIQHPVKPRLNGRKLRKRKDDNGYPLFIKFEETAAAGPEGGWVNYVWPKSGAEKSTPKTSFVKRCPGEKEWVAGSGVWLEDLE